MAALDLQLRFHCTGHVAAAHRAVTLRSEGLAEVQQVRAELLQISARLSATSRPSTTASAEVSSSPPIASANTLLRSHEAAAMTPNTGSAGRIRVRTRATVGEGLHPGSPATPVTPEYRRILTPGQVAL